MNTIQQEFDAVVAHFYEQGRPAKRGPNCVYRSDEGLSCAVGCRIPDDMYHEGMDNDCDLADSAIDTLLESERFVFPPEISKYRSMFLALQNVHDSWVPELDGFEFKTLIKPLRSVADRFNLTFTEPK